MLRGVCEPVHCPEHVGCRSLGRRQEWRILQVPAGAPTLTESPLEEDTISGTRALYGERRAN